MDSKVNKDKYLLICENVITLLALFAMFSLIVLAAFIHVEEWVRGLIVSAGILIVIASCIFALKLEQIAGYYECGNCHNKYTPSFKSVLLASHVGSTRHLKCPNCHKKSWSRKVLEK